MCPSHLPQQKDFKKRKVDVFKKVEGEPHKQSDVLKKEWLAQVETTMSELRGAENAVPRKTQLVMEVRQKAITENAVSYTCKVFKSVKDVKTQKEELKKELLDALKELQNLDKDKRGKANIEESMTPNEVYGALLLDLRSYSNQAFAAIKNNSAKLLAAEAFEKGGLGIFVAKLFLKTPDEGNNIACELVEGRTDIVLDLASHPELKDDDGNLVIAEGDEVRENVRKQSNEVLENGPVFYESKDNLTIISELKESNGKLTITLCRSGHSTTSFQAAKIKKGGRFVLNFREALPRPTDVWQRVTTLLTYWLHRADIGVLKKKLALKDGIKKGGCCAPAFKSPLTLPQRKALREELRKTDYYNKLLFDVHIGKGNFKDNLKVLASLNAADTGADGDDDGEDEEIVAADDSITKAHDKQFKKPVAKQQKHHSAPPGAAEAGYPVPDSDKASMTNGTPTSFTLNWSDVKRGSDAPKQYQVKITGVPGTDAQTEMGIQVQSEAAKQEALKDRIITVDHASTSAQSLSIGSGEQNALVPACEYSVQIRALWKKGANTVEGEWSKAISCKTERSWPASFLSSQAGEEQSYTAPQETVAPSFMNSRAPFAAPPVQASELEASLDSVPDANPVTKEQLSAFFQKHNPSNVSNVDAILATYKGNSAELRKGLKEKYGDDV